MFSPIRISIALLLLASAAGASAQTARPQFRPCVLRSGEESFARHIDEAGLVQKGQKNGAVMFAAIVSKTGDVVSSWTYRGTPETQALEEEIARALKTSRFTVPLYEHQPVGVLLYGTVAFHETKPHLRIFLNQDPRELDKGSDFIGPQPVIGADSRFTGLRAPEGVQVPDGVTPIAALKVKVDAKGTLNELSVNNEEPPDLGFGLAAQANLEGAKFIPAFRDGDAIESETILPLCYKPASP